jgi:hypothetical protein
MKESKSRKVSYAGNLGECFGKPTVLGEESRKCPAVRITSELKRKLISGESERKRGVGL